MSEEFLGDRKQALEDAFFHQLEAQKIEAKRAELSRRESVAELRRISGIDDDEVLGRLAQLGVTGDAIAAVSLVPLIVVAWADGQIQNDEREAILQAAGAKGIEHGSHAYDLLAGWLSAAPRDELFNAWRGYVEALTRSMTDAQVEILERQVVGLARDVAYAAGGVLGVNRISSAEKAALEAIAGAFQHRNA